MRYLTLEEIAEKTDYSLQSLRLFAQKGKLPYIYKRSVKRLIESSKKKKYVIERMMWVVDIDKIDALMNFLKQLKNKSKEESTGWTRSSIECYRAKLIYANCQNYQVCADIESHEHRKPIKEKTIALYKMYGAPPERIFGNE